VVTTVVTVRLFKSYKALKTVPGANIDNALFRTEKSLTGYGLKPEQYLNNRKWTWDSAQDVVRNPYTTRNALDKATGNPATAYYNKAGDYIVRNDVTGQLVQASRFGDIKWHPDSSIVNPYRP